MSTPENNTAPDNFSEHHGRLLAAKEAAAYLGLSVSSFRRYVVPYMAKISIGRAVRYDRLDLDTWADVYKSSHASEPKRSMFQLMSTTPEDLAAAASPKGTAMKEVMQRANARRVSSSSVSVRIPRSDDGNESPAGSRREYDPRNPAGN